MLRKWLRVLGLCSALSELLSVSDLRVAAPPDSGWHGAVGALAVLCADIGHSLL